MDILDNDVVFARETAETCVLKRCVVRSHVAFNYLIIYVSNYVKNSCMSGRASSVHVCDVYSCGVWEQVREEKVYLSK